MEWFGSCKVRPLLMLFTSKINFMILILLVRYLPSKIMMELLYESRNYLPNLLKMLWSTCMWLNLMMVHYLWFNGGKYKYHLLIWATQLKRTLSKLRDFRFLRSIWVLINGRISRTWVIDPSSGLLFFTICWCIEELSV